MRWVEELDPDLVHGHVLHLHLSFGLVRALDKEGLPVVLTAHDTGIFCPTKYVCRPPENPNSPATAKDCASCLRFRYLPGRATVTTGLVNRHVKAVASVSRALAGILQANGVERVEVIPNGLDPRRLAGEGWPGERFRKELSLGNDPLVLFGGRLHRLKGDEEALRALAGVASRFPARLVIAGQKELFNSRLQALAKELGIEDRIVLAGWLERERMLGAYRAASAVLVPSIYPDPFPTVNLEAMALSRPVVGTRFGGTPEVVEDGRTGYVVDPRDAEETAGALARLLEDQDRAERMGRAGAERIEKKFSLKLQCDRFLELYQRVM
jgi:type III pantothenate kinase